MFEIFWSPSLKTDSTLALASFTERSCDHHQVNASDDSTADMRLGTFYPVIKGWPLGRPIGHPSYIYISRISRHQRLANHPILHIPCHQQLSTLTISSHQRSQYGFKLGPVGSNTVQSISCAKQNVQSIITSASLISLGFCSVKWSGLRVLRSRSRVLWQFRSRPWSSQRKLWNRCYQGGT